MHKYQFNFAEILVESIINTVVMIFMLEYYNYRQKGGRKGSTYEHIFVNFVFSMVVMLGVYYIFHRFTMFGHTYKSPIYAELPHPV